MDSLVRKQGCDEECPVKKTAGIIEGKWTTLVIRELLPHKKRYLEIQCALTGISPKVLTSRLRMARTKRTNYPYRLCNRATNNRI